MEDRDLTEQEQVRRSKLEKYAELGVNPFGQNLKEHIVLFKSKTNIVIKQKKNLLTTNQKSH